LSAEVVTATWPEVHPEREQRFEDLATGRSRLLVFGRHAPTRLNRAQRVEWGDARDRGWLKLRSESVTPLSTLWSHWCNVAQLPDIRVRRTAKFAYVTADFVQTGRGFSFATLALLEPALTRHGRAWVSSYLCTVKRIAHENASEVAHLLLETWQATSVPSSDLYGGRQ
jgi:hypothetical protein